MIELLLAAQLIMLLTGIGFLMVLRTQTFLNYDKSELKSYSS